VTVGQLAKGADLVVKRMENWLLGGS